MHGEAYLAEPTGVNLTGVRSTGVISAGVSGLYEHDRAIGFTHSTSFVSKPALSVRALLHLFLCIAGIPRDVSKWARNVNTKACIWDGGDDTSGSQGEDHSSGQPKGRRG